MRGLASKNALTKGRYRWLAIMAGTVGLAAVYWFPMRRRLSRWGATVDEIGRAMPGDELIKKPTRVGMQVVTINASPDQIWPWIAQMGDNRGGFYSYDSLDRLFGFLAHPSATRILPEFQELAIGDKILMGREVLTVSEVDPPRTLVLSYQARGLEWVWQFGLYPFDERHTRLVTRGTERSTSPAGWLLLQAAEPAAFVMTTRMLSNLKRRVEGAGALAA